jgi:hypothetical protein
MIPLEWKIEAAPQIGLFKGESMLKEDPTL